VSEVSFAFPQGIVELADARGKAPKPI